MGLSREGSRTLTPRHPARVDDGAGGRSLMTKASLEQGTRLARAGHCAPTCSVGERRTGADAIARLHAQHDARRRSRSACPRACARRRAASRRGRPARRGSPRRSPIAGAVQRLDAVGARQRSQSSMTRTSPPWCCDQRSEPIEARRPIEWPRPPARPQRRDLGARLPTTSRWAASVRQSSRSDPAGPGP